jgi:hypothetical protein
LPVEKPANMKRKNLWVTLSLVNLCILALFGMTLRTKFVLPISFIDYKNFLSAHSHFAFGGWVTLALMILFIDNLLTDQQKQKTIYQWILGGIEVCALGMVISFPFHGYAFFSILFSTVFIFFTYAFSWVFVRDILKAGKDKLIRLLSIGAIASLVISSGGPFTLAYIMSAHVGDAFMYKDAVYSFMHFQYNGFFTLSVLCLFFNQVIKIIDEQTQRKMWRFAIFLCLSVIPSLFLSLLWHSYNIYIRVLAIIGGALIIITIFFFLGFIFNKKLYAAITSQVARNLLALAMISFGIKMILQIGTIFPSLGNAVFGYRPIIIGFLHLVFLGLVTFYILSNFIQHKIFAWENRSARFAVGFFSASILINETILLIDGIGLMFYMTARIFPWLLWMASILLFTGAVLMLLARLRSLNTSTV